MNVNVVCFRCHGHCGTCSIPAAISMRFRFRGAYIILITKTHAFGASLTLSWLLFIIQYYSIRFQVFGGALLRECVSNFLSRVNVITPSSPSPVQYYPHPPCDLIQPSSTYITTLIVTHLCTFLCARFVTCYFLYHYCSSRDLTFLLPHVNYDTVLKNGQTTNFAFFVSCFRVSYFLSTYTTCLGNECCEKYMPITKRWNAPAPCLIFSGRTYSDL